MHRAPHYVPSFAGETTRISLAEISRIGHIRVGELPNDVQPELTQTRHLQLRDKIYIFTNGPHVQTPTAESELGAQGVGESGVGGAPSAVMNAINDALKPFGARVRGIRSRRSRRRRS